MRKTRPYIQKRQGWWVVRDWFGSVHSLHRSEMQARRVRNKLLEREPPDPPIDPEQLLQHGDPVPEGMRLTFAEACRDARTGAIVAPVDCLESRAHWDSKHNGLRWRDGANGGHTGPLVLVTPRLLALRWVVVGIVTR